MRSMFFACAVLVGFLAYLTFIGSQIIECRRHNLDPVLGVAGIVCVKGAYHAGI